MKASPGTPKSSRSSMIRPSFHTSNCLNVFWKGHDPTQLNRQGPDVGTQYRSVIFYHSPEQRKAALKSYHELTAAHVFPGPIVTQLVPMKAFYRAEEYHQNYYGGKDGRPSANQSRARRLRKPATKSKSSRSTAKSDTDSSKPVARPDGSPIATPATVSPKDTHAETTRVLTMGNRTRIVGGIRTPIGSLNGSLSSIPAPQLAASCIRALLERTGATGSPD